MVRFDMSLRWIGIVSLLVSAFVWIAPSASLASAAGTEIRSAAVDDDGFGVVDVINVVPAVRESAEPIPVLPEPVGLANKPGRRLGRVEFEMVAAEAVGRPVRANGSAVGVQVLREAEVTPKNRGQAGDPPGYAIGLREPVLPVSLPAEAVGRVPAGTMRVEVVSTVEAMAAGLDGVGVWLRPDEALRREMADGPVWVRLEFDWGVLEDNYGADWPDRLGVVAFDACRFVVPGGGEGCDGAAVDVPTVFNDRVRKVLVAEVDLRDVVARVDRQPGGLPIVVGEGRVMSASSGGPGFGLSAGASSQYGNFAATSLSANGKWSVGANTGGFVWSYPVAMPAPPAGPVPSVSLDYSSQAVDGLTADENTQGGVLGVGWGMPNAFIERRYKGCSADGGAAGNGSPCWFNDNAMLSLNGQSGELVKLAGSDVWRLESDAGWRIERFKNASEGQGSIGVDSNGEYWVVTTQEGTQYWFGFGKVKGTTGTTPDVPGSSGAPGTELKSVWTVPVYGNHSGEPCAALSGSWCHQTYRWMLDRVVDANGRVSVYRYNQHVNTFGRGGAPANATKYVSGGELVNVEYGVWDTETTTESATSKVEFVYQFRCNTLSSTCVVPTSTTGNNYPDIPADEICGENATYCEKYAPTYFDWRFLDRIDTFRRIDPVGSVSWAIVDRVELTHLWVDNDDEDSVNKEKLWLWGVQRRSYQSAANIGNLTSPTYELMPVVVFSYAPESRLANRSDYLLSAGVTKQKYYRIDSITEELGGRVEVDYSGVDTGCPGSGNWSTNTKRCYPRYYNPAFGSPGFAIWNKYMVTQIRYDDVVRDQPTVVTTYQWGTSGTAGMAWAYDDDPMQEPTTRSWGQYRGFGHVNVDTGTGAAASRVSTAFYRGMHGDNDGTGGTKNVPIVDSLGTASNDERWLAGMPLEVVHRSAAVPGTEYTRTFHSYVVTKSSSGTGNATIARRVAPATVLTKVEMATGGDRWSRTEYGYDSTGRSVTVDNEGNVDTASATNTTTSDDTCSRTWYTNAATGADGRFFEGLPRQEALIDGAGCPTLVDANALSVVKTWYDGAADWSAGEAVVPIRGNPTRTRVYTSWAATSKTETTYETSGWRRPGTSTDPLNHSTTTTYVPFASNRNVASATVTNSAGHTDTTHFDAFGRPWKSIDTNDRQVVSCFDLLGRTTRVYLSDTNYTACNSGTASLTFEYIPVNVTASPANTTAWKVKSNRLFAAANDFAISNPAANVYVSSMVFLDGFGRSVQNVVPSPTPGQRVITRTIYDDAGRAVVGTAPYTSTGTVDSSYDTTSPTAAGIRSAISTYDPAGRVTLSMQRYGTTNVREQQTVYDGLLTTTRVPAAPGTSSSTGATTHETDVFGRLTKTTENSSTNAAGIVVNTDTVYEYNNRGQVTIVDPPVGGNTVTTYDLAGRVITFNEPNQGRTSMVYDDAGRARCITNGNGQQTYNHYDNLGRVLATYVVPNGTPCPTGNAAQTWTKTAAFTYDPTGNKGTTATATAYDTVAPGNAATVSATAAGFDTRGRLTSTTIQVHAANGPASTDDALSAAYTFTQAYTRDNQIWKTTYPQVSANGSTLISAEEVKAGFNSLGMPTNSASSGFTYVGSTGFDDVGRITDRTLGGTGTSNTLTRRYWYEATDGRLARMDAIRNVGTSQYQIEDDFYTYDHVGNPTQVRREPAAFAAMWEQECFRYDGRQRLTRAYTTAHTTSTPAAACASNTTIGGPNPYDDTYRYDQADRTILNGPTANPRTYNYATPAASCNGWTAGRQWAASSITNPGGTGTQQSFTYDCNGNTIGRSQSGVATTYAWDIHNRLLSTTTAGTSTSNVYDAAGQRAMRTDISGTVTTKTVYLGTMELRWQSATGAVTASRTYQGAIRDHDNTVRFLNTNQQASIATTLTTSGFVTHLRYKPYGNLRTGNAINDKAFLGEIHDSVTNTHYLNARHYNADTATFLSVDPIVANTQHPYDYANHNPITGVDPSGLGVMDFAHGLLDVAGVVPVVGEFADGANALIYVAEGDYTNAAISAAGMIPIAGTAATGTRLVAKYADEVIEVGTKAIVRETAEEATERLLKETSSFVAHRADEINPAKRINQLTENSIESRRGATEAASGGSKPFAMGIDDHLDDFASQHGATTWKQNADVVNWKPEVLEKLADPNQRVLFNLDGVEVGPGLARAASGRGGATDWELLTIRQNNFPNLEFWNRGQRVRGPF